MAKPPPTRPVQCYHCRHRFEVAAQARTSSCPKCAKGLQLDDVVISDYHAVRRIQTCGRLVVNKKGRVVAQLVEASGDMEIQGTVEGRVVCAGRVHLGPKAHLKGDCAALSLAVESGATVGGGLFLVPDPALAPPPSPPAGDGALAAGARDGAGAQPATARRAGAASSRMPSSSR